MSLENPFEHPSDKSRPPVDWQDMPPQPELQIVPVTPDMDPRPGEEMPPEIRDGSVPVDDFIKEQEKKDRERDKKPPTLN